MINKIIQTSTSFILKFPLRSGFFIAVLSTLIVFFKTTGNTLIEWDNSMYILNNPYIKEITIENILKLAGIYIYWMPLTWLSHFMDYQIGGDSPFTHLFGNVLLHSINAGILFLISYEILAVVKTKSEKKFIFLGAITAALLWSLHPLRVEVVAWAAERKEVLSTHFMLASILNYLIYKTSKKKFYYIMSIGLSISALASKPSAVVLPIALLLIDIYPFKEGLKNIKKILIEKVPYFILSFIVGIMALLGQSKIQAITSLEQLNFMSRFFGVFYRLTFYIKKTILPLNLSPHYPVYFVERLDMELVLSIAVIFLLVIHCILNYRKRPFILISFLFFLFSLLPVLGIIQVGNITHADRWTYLSTIGFFIVLGGVLIWCLEKVNKNRRLYISIPIIILLLVMSTLTRNQIDVWYDDMSFWKTVQKLGRDKIPGAYHNIGRLYEKRGNLNNAKEMYEKAITIQSNFSPSLISLGGISTQENNVDDAKKYYNAAILSSPNDYKPQFNLALIFYKEGRINTAVKNLSLSYKKLKEKNIPYIKDEMRILKLWSYLTLQQKNYKQSLFTLHEMIRLNPSDDNSYYIIGQIFLADNRADDGINYIKKAIEINPNNARYYFTLGEVYESLKQYKEALSYYETARLLNPGNKEAELKINNILKMSN